MKNSNTTFLLIIVLFVSLIVSIGLGWYAFNTQSGQAVIMKDEQAYLAKKLSRHSATLEELNKQLKDIERMVQQDRTKGEDIVNKVMMMEEAIQSWSTAVDEMENKISNPVVESGLANEKDTKQVDTAVEAVDLGAVSIDKSSSELIPKNKKTGEEK